MLHIRLALVSVFVFGVVGCSADNDDSGSWARGVRDEWTPREPRSESGNFNLNGPALDWSAINAINAIDVSAPGRRWRVSDVVDLAIARGVTRQAELLAALPPSLIESHVLVKDSQSLQASTLAHPRAVLFGTDARLLLGVSSLPDDPRFNVIEMAELDDDTGTWRFSSLELSEGAPRHDTDDTVCLGCHGSPARPIWGQYPTWPTAIGNQGSTLNQEDWSAVARIKNDVDDPLHALPRAEWDYSLLSRMYGYPNTAFNFEVAAAAAQGLFTRAAARADFREQRRELLRQGWCEWQPDAALAAAGFTSDDTRLDLFAGDATADLAWNQGHTSLADIWLLLVLNDAIEDDVGIAGAVAPVDDVRRAFTRGWFGILGDDRRALLADPNFAGVLELRPQQIVLAPVMGDLCAELSR